METQQNVKFCYEINAKINAINIVNIFNDEEPVTFGKIYQERSETF